ncbi:glycosyl hydrolase family 61-domain-containing protein [Crucibulum laeve]|uniref:lytic cellulose monooxygenase (C4-dehydrogenating) n=1 Tax=Crucibulum laeve TaxID=68775 RepID=A0A5C3MSU0_9AGAR|nr:glycosyl hydrolase family 61-domain-containing protein [Crucibulum laeve]
MYPLLPFCIFLLSIASVLPEAAGHGFVHSVLVGDQDYPGWNPFTDPYTDTPARIVRKVSSDGPIAPTDADLACGHGGNDGTAALANIQAGSKVTFQWTNWPADHQGPVSSYMTSCNGDCTKFAANDAKWFKVDASGYDPTTKLWAADNLIADNNSWTSTIPAALAPGQYLIRNEIIALHSIGSPQFYPSCSQIQVSGSGTGQPSDSELVTMEALYSAVSFPDIYSDFGTFTIPGPAPVTFGGSAPIASSSAPPAPSKTSTAIAVGQQTSATSTPMSTTRPTGHCSLSSRRLARRRFARSH